MYETYVTITGRLVADPETRTTRAGQVFTTFRLATSERRRTRDGVFEDGPTSFYNVAAYRALGVNTRTALHKGEPVVVVGRQRVRQYQRSDESYGTSVEVEAMHVGHDLLWGQTVFSRPVRDEGDVVEAGFGGEEAVPGVGLVDRLSGEIGEARHEHEGSGPEGEDEQEVLEEPVAQSA
ncbi:single-stranded DNA-binding protein [Janibacter melonis]|uniref:single-stranded DNA-binding protein n=1 Tax=Janibacter melonis TaxID=262209 RepID=UPI002094DA75|nr:single-stranded DNA-binding protein [Janibacter melonis]